MSKLEFKLPFEPNQKLFWISEGFVRDVYFKGIRQDKGYYTQIICMRMKDSKMIETPLCSIESFGETLFDNKHDAEKALCR